MKNTPETKQKKSPHNTGDELGRFVKGDPRINLAGRPPGSKNFSTDFDEVVQEIAELNNITVSEAKKILFKKAYAEAKSGNFPFYKDIMDRYYGKAMESLDVTSGGKPIPIYGGASIQNQEHNSNS